jgi:hypothetical protein
MENIKGKIVKIIDEYNIIVNLGYDDGIKYDTLLEIYEKGPEIKDNETFYGTLDIVKATIKPKMISQKVSLWTNNDFFLKKIYKNPQNKLLEQFSKTLPLFTNIPEEVEVISPLKISRKSTDISFNLEKSLFIKIGDLVRISRT